MEASTFDCVVDRSAEETYMRLSGMNGQKLDMPIHLKEYDTVETARIIFFRIQSCRSCFMPKLYLPFSLQNGTTGCLAAIKRGVSLHDYLQLEANQRRFVDHHQNQPYQPSYIYKQIFRCLLVIGRSLVERDLKCSFDLKHIFIMLTGDDVRVEVVDFDLSVQNSVEVWRRLADCVGVINNILSSISYSGETDVTMCKVLRRLRATTSDNNFINEVLMKSTFFWSWHMKKNFISRVKQSMNCKVNLPLWERCCNQCFKIRWEADVDRDPDLKGFQMQQQIAIARRASLSAQPSHSSQPLRPSSQSSRQTLPPLPSSQQPPKTCVSFIRGSFEHFFVSSKQHLNIRSMKELQKRFDFIFGDYCETLIMQARQMKNMKNFGVFIDSTIYSEI